jgi:hypothetical protein
VKVAVNMLANGTPAFREWLQSMLPSTPGREKRYQPFLCLGNA